MKRILSIICLLIPIVGINSCNESYEESPVILDESSEIDWKIQRSPNQEHKSFIQSNAEFIILQHITINDAEIFLNMTEEDAKELNIPSSLYDQYVNFVNLMNSER